MCVLSTLCGNVDKHSTFDIYIYICMSVCLSDHTCFMPIYLPTNLQICYLASYLALLTVEFQAPHWRRSIHQSLWYSYSNHHANSLPHHTCIYKSWTAHGWLSISCIYSYQNYWYSMFLQCRLINVGIPIIKTKRPYLYNANYICKDGICIERVPVLRIDDTYSYIKSCFRCAEFT